MLKSTTEGSQALLSQHDSTPRLRPRDDTSPSSAPVSALFGYPPSHKANTYIPKQHASLELDADTQARQIRARERLAILRGRVWRTRRDVKAQRAELRRTRKTVQEANDQLMKKINGCTALDRIPSDLVPYFEKVRSAQDALGPIEDAYDQLESRLDAEEQDLEDEEDHFTRHHELTPISTVPITESRLNDVISPLAKPYDPPETEMDNLNLKPNNPLIQEYLEKVEEACHLKEYLDVLENEYFQISTDASFRSRHNIVLSAESADFLAEYPTMHLDILEDLHKTEDDLFDLRDECIRQQLFNETEYPYEPRDALSEEVMDSVYDARDRSPLHVAMHENGYYKRERDFEDKREHVNNWLLEWVQDSAYETLLLKAWIYFEYPDGPGKLDTLGDDKWSDLAIQNWDRDDAGESTNLYHSANRLDAIAGQTGRLDATATRQSGITDSFGSLGVFPDFFETGQALSSVVGSHATLPADNNNTPQSSPRKGRPSSV